MKTKFPYEGKIDFQKYWDTCMAQEDAVRSIPTEEELKEQAIKAIVKDHLVLTTIGADEVAETGDSITMATVSNIPKFNKPNVKVSLGRGLYNKELEDMVLGKKIGDQFGLTIQEEPVSVTILDIQRKTAPQPTDEMAAALGMKDDHDQLLATVEDYIKYYVENKALSNIATINYYVMSPILEAYPVPDCEQSDIDRLRELEEVVIAKAVMERDGIDVYKEVPKEWKDHGIETYEQWLQERSPWYPMKIQQCLIYQNILGLPDEGKYDPLDHYEVLSELQMLMFDVIKNKLRGE